MRRYRKIDFKRRKDGVPAKVAAIEYDPNRSARLALIVYRDGEKRYIIAPNDLRVGDPVISGPDAEARVGNCLPLEHIPTGTMSGTNPDGSHYHDPGLRYISYFNGGDALHYFPRGSYGSPQSLGCVELPLAAAAAIESEYASGKTDEFIPPTVVDGYEPIMSFAEDSAAIYDDIPRGDEEAAGGTAGLIGHGGSPPRTRQA